MTQETQQFKVGDLVTFSPASNNPRTAHPMKIDSVEQKNGFNFYRLRPGAVAYHQPGLTNGMWIDSSLEPWPIH